MAGEGGDGRASGGTAVTAADVGQAGDGRPAGAVIVAAAVAASTAAAGVVVSALSGSRAEAALPTLRQPPPPQWRRGGSAAAPPGGTVAAVFDEGRAEDGRWAEAVVVLAAAVADVANGVGAVRQTARLPPAPQWREEGGRPCRQRHGGHRRGRGASGGRDASWGDEGVDSIIHGRVPIPSRKVFGGLDSLDVGPNVETRRFPTVLSGRRISSVELIRTK